MISALIAMYNIGSNSHRVNEGRAPTTAKDDIVAIEVRLS